MKLDDVNELIRGKKGTVLRLQLLPAGATDPSKRRVVELVRDTVKLTDEEANAEIIEKPLPDGTSRRFGWITLPSFYEDPGKFGLGKSASRDVAALIKRLNQEKIQGLVVDLRSNGGGSLDEAVNMSGLFILKTRMEGPKIASFCSRVSICGSMGSHLEGPSRSDGISLMLSRLRRFDSRHSRF
jgi:carboxyl-terminal processing protease